MIKQLVRSCGRRGRVGVGVQVQVVRPCVHVPNTRGGSVCKSCIFININMKWLVLRDVALAAAVAAGDASGSVMVAVLFAVPLPVKQLCRQVSAAHLASPKQQRS